MSCPTISKKYDAAGFRIAYKLFVASFNGFADLRHSVAHAGLVGNQKHHVWGTHDAGGLKISSSQIEGMIIGTIIADSLVTTAWKGKMVSYKVNRASSDKLIRVQTLCYAAFKGAELA